MRKAACFLLAILWIEPSVSQFTNVPINDQYSHQGQPTIAASPVYDELLCATWIRMDTYPEVKFYIGWAISQSGGLSRGNYGYLSPPEFPHGVEPSVAFDRDGPYETSVHCVYAEVTANGGYGRINHVLMEDFQGWSDTVQVSNATSRQRDPEIAIDNDPESEYEGRVYVAWSEGWWRILFRYSSDRGETWGDEIEIAAAGENLGPDVASWYIDGEADVEAAIVRYPDVVVAPNGHVFVAWYEHDQMGTYTGRISVRRSTDGGDTFDETVTIADPVDFGVCNVGNARPQIRPSLAASPNGSLFMVTADRKTEQDPDAYVRFFRSDDDGDSWTETWYVLSGSEEQDFFPDVTVTPNGQVHVTFTHSNASEPCSYEENSLTVWVATSNDDGLTFEEPRQVSPGYSPNSGEMAYFKAGAVSSFVENRVYPVWTDHRDNHPVPYVAITFAPPAPPQNVAITTHNTGSNAHPKLTWAANSEPDLEGYDIWRRIISPHPPESTPWEFFTSVDASTTQYIDTSILWAGTGNWTVRYRLKAVDAADQRSAFSDSVSMDYGDVFKQQDAETGKPRTLRLHQNYPNPFNPETTIEYEIPEDGRVSLKLFDLLGRGVATLVNEVHTAGVYKAYLSSHNLASGTYILRLEHHSMVLNKKVMVVR